MTRYGTFLFLLLTSGVSSLYNISARERRGLQGPLAWDMQANKIDIDLDHHRVDGTKLMIVGVLKSLDNTTEGQIIEALQLCSYFDDGHCGMMLMSSLVSPTSMEHVKTEAPHANFEVVQDVHVAGTRTHKLAGLRNAVLDSAMKKDWDFLMVTDLDNTVVWDAQTFSGVLNAIKLQDNWDGVTFTATQYYDWWAARCDKDTPNCVAHRSCRNRTIFPCIAEAILDENPDHFYPVRSAFNAVALYKRNAIGDCRYDGKNTDPSAPHARQDCEHVTFHDCIAANGNKIMLNSGRLHILWSNYAKKKHKKDDMDFADLDGKTATSSKTTGKAIVGRAAAGKALGKRNAGKAWQSGAHQATVSAKKKAAAVRKASRKARTRQVNYQKVQNNYARHGGKSMGGLKRHKHFDIKH